MSRFLAILTGLALLPLLGGYLGGLHPLGDSLAVFRAQGAMGLALLSALALMTGAGRTGWLGLLVAGLAGGPLIWGYLGPVAAGGDLRLYQKNMLFRNDDLAGLQADIRAAAPDVVTLQEVSVPNQTLLAGLADVLPHQLFCPFAAVGGVAVATRLQPVPGQQICQPGMAALKVQGPKGPVWLISVHLNWPWPYRQSAHLADLLPALNGLDAPVVMAGDFNMVGWGQAMRALRTATGTVAAGPVSGSYTGFAPWLLLPIDHVMAPGGGRVGTRPGLGSDHLGLLADLAL